MSKITTMEALSKWYSGDEVDAANVMGLGMCDDNLWILREQCRVASGWYDPVNLRGDNPLRFLHISRTDPCKVAYTKSAEKGMADIQTTTTLEAYCRKFGLETGEEGRESSDSLREERLEKALENALDIIVGEYPKGDDRYQFAVDTAKKFGITLCEMGA